jgi:hypothetical protein
VPPLLSRGAPFDEPRCLWRREAKVSRLDGASPQRGRGALSQREPRVRER